MKHTAKKLTRITTRVSTLVNLACECGDYDVVKIHWTVGTDGNPAKVLLTRGRTHGNPHRAAYAAVRALTVGESAALEEVKALTDEEAWEWSFAYAATQFDGAVEIDYSAISG